MKNKFQRIELVRACGLNTEENILITPNTDVKDYIKFLNPLDFCSIRTFRNNEVKTPFYPFILKDDALKIISNLQNQGYSVILSTPINPKDCMFAGAAWQTADALIIEIVHGPGTVRRVTHENIIDNIYTLNNFLNEKTDNILLNKCIEQFRKTNLKNVIFEFSWYKIPVGYKKENFICWEITDDGTKKSKIF